MNFPHHQNKRSSASVLTAKALLMHRGVDSANIFRGATAAILCFQKRSLDALTKQYGGQSVKGLSGETSYLRKAGLVVSKPPGVGAPALAVLMEELAACGIGTMIAVGIAGAIGERSIAGDIVVPTGAIRDDGTSHHYLASELPALPTQDVVDRLSASLGSRSLKYSTGSVWTTDAPFRETADEIREFRDQGVLAVDMECAALFSVAEALGVRRACGLVISDSLTGGIWRPADRVHDIDTALGDLSIAAAEALK